MYCSYFYNSSATNADILNDVYAILTGTTDVSTLSASCNKVNTAIDVSASPSGWLPHDGVSVTNKCIRTPIHDDPTRFLYVELKINSLALMTVPGTVWNSVTHAWGAGNLTVASDLANAANLHQRVNNPSAGRMDIYAANGCCLLMYAFVGSATYGNGLYSSPSGVIQRLRSDPWDTVANGYIPAGFVSSISNNSIASFPIRAVTGTDTSTTGATFYPTGYPRYALWPPTVMQTAAEIQVGGVKVMFPISMGATAFQFNGGGVTALSDVWAAPPEGGVYDTITAGSGVYVVWINSASRFAVRRG